MDLNQPESSANGGTPEPLDPGVQPARTASRGKLLVGAVLVVSSSRDCTLSTGTGFIPP